MSLLQPRFAWESDQYCQIAVPVVEIGTEKLPAVLLLHGFQSMRGYHLGTAEKLARFAYSSSPAMPSLDIFSINMS